MTSPTQVGAVLCSIVFGFGCYLWYQENALENTNANANGNSMFFLSPGYPLTSRINIWEYPNGQTLIIGTKYDGQQYVISRS